MYEKRSKSAIFTVFLDKIGRHFEKKANIKKVFHTVLDTYPAVILTKLQIFTMDTHRGDGIFVKSRKTVKMPIFVKKLFFSIQFVWICICFLMVNQENLLRYTF